MEVKKYNATYPLRGTRDFCGIISIAVYSKSTMFNYIDPSWGILCTTIAFTI
jgi:hypothetical protein